MKEFQFYIDLIKELIDSNNLKGTVYYSDGEWYSREHSRNITLEELKEMTLAVAIENHQSNELWERMESFINDNCGDDLLEQFWNENEDLQ